jgi:hypothetical protein
MAQGKHHSVAVYSDISPRVYPIDQSLSAGLNVTKKPVFPSRRIDGHNRFFVPRTDMNMVHGFLLTLSAQF